MHTKTSSISGFYKKSVAERRQMVQAWANLSDEVAAHLQRGGLTDEQANHMIENVIGVHALPFGIATNFLIDGVDYLIPIVIEEPSVVAALSNAGKMFREGGGFETRSDEPIMIGQIQVLDLQDISQAVARLQASEPELLSEINAIGGSIVRSGGGAKAFEYRTFEHPIVGQMLVVHLLYDARDAMGANAINTAAEFIAPRIERLTGGRVNLRILSNLTDRRKAYAQGRVPASLLARDGIGGVEAAGRIVEAAALAEVDPYRAATHNKGIMNGIDGVVLATGNDWRAVEAGAHAYAARDGVYRSLTRWWQDAAGDLWGAIELPLAVGVVGGATKVHPTAQIALQILRQPDARRLAEIMAAVGLAQNFGALRALALEGIQSGHMRMHAKQLVVAAGASSDQVELITEALISSGSIRLEKAKELVEKFNKGMNA
jgi:hydroxymethylglutaryl-CoA reductase